MPGHFVSQIALILPALFEVIHDQILIPNEVGIFVPLIGWVKTVGVMMHLAATCCVIAVILKIMWQSYQVRIRRTPPVAIAVKAGG